MFQQISLSGNHIHKHIPAIIGIIQHNKQIKLIFLVFLIKYKYNFFMNIKPTVYIIHNIFKRCNKIHKLTINISLNINIFTTVSILLLIFIFN